MTLGLSEDKRPDDEPRVKADQPKSAPAPKPPSPKVTERQELEKRVQDVKSEIAKLEKELFVISPDYPLVTDKDWADANIPPPTYFLGNLLFNTQNFALFTMKTDAGKTNFIIALALCLAYAKSYCEWATTGKKAKVLYIEGESSPFNMQRVVRQQRIALGIPDEVATPNFTLVTPDTHGDIPELVVKPRYRQSKNPAFELDRLQAKLWLWKLIKQERPDYIFFDSIQSLAPSMISCSASTWMSHLVRPIATPIHRMGIGQMWLHHPNRTEMEQHGTGARTWRMTLEMFGNALTNRGINFNLTYPGKKKDDLGDNDDFNDRNVQFVRDENGISHWVVTLFVGGEDEPLTREAHRPNKSAKIAEEVFNKLVEVKLAIEANKDKTKHDIWIDAAVGGEWHQACIKAGISQSDKQQAMNKAYTRARVVLLESRVLQQRATDNCLRLFPPEVELEKPVSALQAEGDGEQEQPPTQH
jgi:hypothetical protein